MPGIAVLIVLACVLLVPLAACGGDDDGGTDGTPAAATSPAPTREPGRQTIIDLADEEAVLKLYGAGAGDLASDIPALAAGDFNSDGSEDLAVGARFADPNGLADAGEAYIIFGDEDIGGEVDLADGADVTVQGRDDGDNLGFALTAGDFNGDGVDDLAVGAPFAEGPARRELTTGVAYITFGHEGLAGTLDIAADAADVTLVGNAASAFFGDSLATGEVTGDGPADLVVGATFERKADGTQGGAVYVFGGTTDWPNRISVADGGYTAAVFGQDPLDELGDTVTVGDVNGDGVDDVIATAEAADGPDNDRSVAAEVVIVLGGDDLAGDIDVEEDEIAARIYGAEQNDTLGFDLAAGDLDGDGFADIAMSARLAGGPNNRLGSAGEAYILYGSDSAPGEIDLAESLPQFVGYYSPDGADLLGRTVIVAAGERPGRLLLGAAFGDGPANERREAGEVFVIEPDALAVGLAPADEAAHTIIYGAAAGDTLGASFLPVDIDGDGAGELAIVAAGADPGPNRMDFGIVYVIDGP